MADTSFSTRHGYVRPAPIRPENRTQVPHDLRLLVAESAKRWSIGEVELRKLTWRCLKKDIGEKPEHLWSSFSCGLSDAPWYRVYDIIEAVYAVAMESDAHVEQLPILADDAYPRALGFEQDINDYLVENGIPWQLVAGEIVARGDEAFEVAVNTARTELEEAGRPTAAGRIHDALQALSRRPEPDAAGAVSHAIAALECVAGEITGNDKATFGDVLKSHPELFPGGLKKAVEGVWGYSCNEGARHGKEGKEPEREGAALIVGLAAVVATYLNRKARTDV